MAVAARPMKLAVVGAGPSAFYVASRLLSLLPRDTPQGDNLQIHMYDKLWAPHGLVRYGVAPDHPEVKNCIHKFHSSALDPRFRFFGNVSVAQTSSPTLRHNLKMSLSDLFPYYTHLLIASGSALPQPLPAAIQSTPALSVVHWYTGHPFNPPAPALDKIKHLTLIGHGNVSLDIARLLLTPPSVLSKLDIPEHVLEVLRKSTVEHVSIVSRRGPAEAAFTAKELRELLNLPSATLQSINPQLLETPAGASRQQSRILDLLRKGSAPKGASPPDARKTTWSLDFFRSPLSTSPGKITYAINELDEQGRARPTGATETQETDSVVSSVGSRSDAFSLPGLSPQTTVTTTTTTTVSSSASDVPPTATTTVVGQADPWFDSVLGRVRNIQGRVVDTSGERVRNVYASGWAANGAKGVLATTMYDAYAVAGSIISDQQGLVEGAEYGIGIGAQPMSATPPAGAPEVVEKGLSACGDGRVISYDDWMKIDAEEERRGPQLGKPRERMTWDEVDAFLQ